MNVKKGLVLLAGATIMATALVSPAAAHTALREATPADGSTVDALPAEVSALLGGIVTEGAVQVLDPCGSSVTTGDTELETVSIRVGQPEAPGSRLTVPTAGERTGNYQAIWTAVGADGHAVGGAWDFNVVSGEGCTKVSREDAEDNANGIDITSVTTKKLKDPKAILVSLKTADAVAIGDLSKAIDEDSLGTTLDLVIENTQDTTIDFRGRFIRQRGELRLLLGSDDLETKIGNYAARAKGDAISVKIPQKVVRPEVGKFVDVWVESRGNTEDCGETGCADIAPDYGYLRALSR